MQLADKVHQLFKLAFDPSISAVGSKTHCIGQRILRCKKHLSLANNGLRGAVNVDQSFESATGFDIIHR